MADQAAILTAFIMGAPLEALSFVLHVDAEAALRLELLRIASEASKGQADRPDAPPERKRKARAAAGKKAAPPAEAAGRTNGHDQAAAKTAPRPRTNGHAAAGDDGARQATWRDTIRTALTALGPATIDEIDAHLNECGITRPRSLISTTLGQLRGMGQVEKRGEQWVLNHK
jgi:hypothetical protein